MKKQNEDKIIKLYKKNPGEIQAGDGNVIYFLLFIKILIKNYFIHNFQIKIKNKYINKYNF